ncbi:DNA methyltransferase [Bacteroides sp.]|uniref:DNA methyltransferase n=1 Tax=Bacteroides sp. TaxID=29523 RepID=UPI002620B4EA|nr:DNA methyltransferase [Bacteroides sp.]MDD3041242.1 DNA methyltransferase [Bacteroides sp.]
MIYGRWLILIVELYNEDCLVGMNRIPNASVDMILCDLPYGTTQNKWDTIIPFDKLWLSYKRIIKPNGAIVLNASEPFTSLLVSSNMEMYRYSWVWIKNTPTGFINAHQQPLKLYEDICVFSNAGVSPSSKNKMTYNPQGLTDFGKVTKRGSAGKNYNSVSTENFQEKSNYPRNVLTFPKDSKKLHPTQKPVALLEYLIRTYTNEGEDYDEFDGFTAALAKKIYGSTCAVKREIINKSTKQEKK